MKSATSTTMDEQYEAAASEAHDATKRAGDGACWYIHNHNAFSLLIISYNAQYSTRVDFFGADRFKSWCLPFFGVFFGADQNLGFLLVHEVFYLVLFSVGVFFGVQKCII